LTKPLSLTLQALSHLERVVVFKIMCARPRGLFDRALMSLVTRLAFVNAGAGLNENKKGHFSLSERFTSSVLQIGFSLMFFKISGINRDEAALKRLACATRALNG
jgi:hypothetical protein